MVKRPINEVKRQIAFYRDTITGKQPAKEFLYELSKKSDKKSQVAFKKFPVYANVLLMLGARLCGENYVKKIMGIREDIWELRPGDARIFFVTMLKQIDEEGNLVETYILLHGFQKRTNKTPPREIERAQREFQALQNGEADIVKDGGLNE